jgi:hypothetical protein
MSTIAPRHRGLRRSPQVTPGRPVPRCPRSRPARPARAGRPAPPPGARARPCTPLSRVVDPPSDPSWRRGKGPPLGGDRGSEQPSLPHGASSTAGTNAAIRSPGRRRPRRSCPVLAVHEFQTRDTSGQNANAATTARRTRCPRGRRARPRSARLVRCRPVARRGRRSARPPRHGHLGGSQGATGSSPSSSPGLG